MKTLVYFSIVSLLFCGLSTNLYSQSGCGGGTVWDTYTVTVYNNTNCEMEFAWEAGQIDCEGCGGRGGAVGPYSDITLTAYNCSLEETTCDVLLWARAYPSSTSCDVIQVAQDYDDGYCGGGGDQPGMADNCCIADWKVTLTDPNRVDIDFP